MCDLLGHTACFFSHLFSGKPRVFVCVLVAQLCPALCNPMDGSSSVHGIFQAGTLEWVAISSSKVSSRSRNRIQIWLYCRQILYHLSHQRNPHRRGKGHILYLTAICSDFIKFQSLRYWESSRKGGMLTLTYLLAGITFSTKRAPNSESILNGVSGRLLLGNKVTLQVAPIQLNLPKMREV